MLAMLNVGISIEIEELLSLLVVIVVVKKVVVAAPVLIGDD